MSVTAGKAASWLPFLPFTPMPSQPAAQIRSRMPFGYSRRILHLGAAAFFAMLAFGSDAQSGSATPATAPSESIPLVSADQMSATDQPVARSWQQAISRSALFYGYAVDSTFSYRKIDCPVAPNALILAYEAASANGAVSRFTAVVPRESEAENTGRHALAQIIPILHFGLTPFLPAIANPHSIAVFNIAVSPAPAAVNVLRETDAGESPLLVRGLCFLAMVGEEPAALRKPSLDAATIQAPIPTVQFQNQGRIRQLISVRSSPTTYQVWALTFSPIGQLMSTAREQHPIDTTPVLNEATTAAPPVASPSILPGGLPSASAKTTYPDTPPMASPPSVAEAPTATPPSPVVETHAPPPAPMPASPAATAPSSQAIATPPAPAPTEEETSPPPPMPVASPAISTAAPTSPAIAPVIAPAPSALPPSPTPPPATAQDSSSTTLAASTTLSATRPTLPQPPRVFIPDPPQPPHRFIPASALQTPPHLPQ